MSNCRSTIIITIAIIAAELPATNAQNIDYKGFPQWSWHVEGQTEYYLYTPDGAAPGKLYPVAVFLHGCCGEDDHATLRNAVDPPARMWHNFGQNTQIEPTWIISPKTTRGWEQKFEDIKRVIDALIEEGKADPQRIYMTGFSMGGGGTWQFIEKYPGYVAAAIPMGTGIRVDMAKVKDTPVWAIRGEKDYFARGLPEQIAEMRKLNGCDKGAGDWMTGVNPRFTDFKGEDHGIQWKAASELDLLKWAYSQVNNGNVAPAIYFESPGYRQMFPAKEKVEIELRAFDPDGQVKKVEVYLDKKLRATLTEAPYKATISLTGCNNLVEAVAYDDKGKSATATNILLTACTPKIQTSKLAEAQQGTMYRQQLSATGNEPFEYSLAASSELPMGLSLEPEGVIQGIAQQPGDFKVTISVRDSDGQMNEKGYRLRVCKKLKDDVVLTSVQSPNDVWAHIIAKMEVGALPNTQAGTEVSFSRIGEYKGLTYISTSQLANDTNGQDAISFTVDEDVKLYVAYETLDNLFKSTVPDWLKSFNKVQKEQIVAQYHYFDVYEKDYPKGVITLPGADAKRNGVTRNYFVMLMKK